MILHHIYLSYIKIMMVGETCYVKTVRIYICVTRVCSIGGTIG